MQDCILFNRGDAEAEISVAGEELGYPRHFTAFVRDLWEKKDLVEFAGN